MGDAVGMDADVIEVDGFLASVDCQPSAIGRTSMPYLAGFLTGVFFTVLVVFLVDNVAVATTPAGTEPQKIVNWDVAKQKLGSSITAVQKGAQEVREATHEVTALHAVAIDLGARTLR